jgi:ketosteroid isomerase-like protein
MTMADAATVHAALDAYNKGGFDALSPYLAEDVVWHVGGRHALSGTYRGREAVAGYHGQVAEMTGGTLHLEPIDVIAGETHAAVFLRATGERGDHRLDVELAEAIRLDGSDRWAEYWAASDQQEAVDTFWGGEGR